MKYICLILIILTALHTKSYSQQKKSGEIGLNIGGSYYLGDLNRTPFKGTRLTFGGFFRHTFDERFALRTSINYINLYADDSKSTNGFQQQRDASFAQNLFDLNVVGEFHFIPFLPAKYKYYKYSPFVFLGLGYSYLPNGSSNSLFTIPFGLGLKFNLRNNLSLSFETTFYKTFKDDIENQLDAKFYTEPSPENPFKQLYYVGDNDWYSIFGIKLSYKIKYKMKCPAFD